MDPVKISCPKCKTESSFKEFELLESALLVCPVCKTEFSLMAQLSKIGGAETPEDEIPDLGTELSLEPAEPTPAPAPTDEPMPPVEEPPVPEGESRRREPDIQARVLTCTTCNKDWVHTHATHCPYCNSSKVMVSTKSLSQRAGEALDEVDRGVPAARALNRMLGRPSETQRPRVSRMSRGARERPIYRAKGRN